MTEKTSLAFPEWRESYEEYHNILMTDEEAEEQYRNYRLELRNRLNSPWESST